MVSTIRLKFGSFLEGLGPQVLLSEGNAEAKLLTLANGAHMVQKSMPEDLKQADIKHATEHQPQGQAPSEEEAIKSAVACMGNLQGAGLLQCFINVVHNRAAISA